MGNRRLIGSDRPSFDKSMKSKERNNSEKGRNWMKLPKPFAAFKQFYIRLPIFLLIGVIWTERIFYWFTAMPYDHKSFSGHSTMLMWHTVPYIIMALTYMVLCEVIYTFFKRSLKKKEEKNN